MLLALFATSIGNYMLFNAGLEEMLFFQLWNINKSWVVVGFMTITTENPTINMTLILDNHRAMELITLVVDGEASDAETRAFMLFISKDKNRGIRTMYRQEKLTKEIISSKCKKEKAPARLYTFLDQVNNEKD